MDPGHKCTLQFACTCEDLYLYIEMNSNFMTPTFRLSDKQDIWSFWSLGDCGRRNFYLFFDALQTNNNWPLNLSIIKLLLSSVAALMDL